MRRVGSDTSYFEELARRGKASHVHTSHQLAGLEIADMLGDHKHKALYIKLAKQYGVEWVLRIAKSVAEKKGIKNPGAYFMTLLKKERDK